MGLKKSKPVCGAQQKDQRKSGPTWEKTHRNTRLEETLEESQVILKTKPKKQKRVKIMES